ncbi:transposase [Streptomyces sp. NPDC015220]|uniref:transposase n=1 Tax=Streptomyces sp. NPDC015220 TaxID=3364947 RepID=UPI0036FA392D
MVDMALQSITPMTAPDSLPLHALAEENLAAASPDLPRAMIKTFADALMSAEADALCNAEYGQVSDERVNHRNGYRPRDRRGEDGGGPDGAGAARFGAPEPSASAVRP